MMRLLLGAAVAIGATPAVALTVSAPPSPVSASPMRFADPDAALEQTGSMLQQGFRASALSSGTSAALAGAADRSAPVWFGAKPAADAAVLARSSVGTAAGFAAPR